MFNLFFIFLTASTLISANSLPDDSNDSDLNLNTGTFNSDSNGDNEDYLAGLPSSNEVIVANSNPVTHSGCTSDASTVENPEDNIQKRFKVCPAYTDPKAPAPEVQQQHPAEDPKQSTTTENNPCGDAKYQLYVSCAGPEVTNGGPIFKVVLNCVPGILFKLLLTLILKAKSCLQRSPYI